MVNAFPLVPPMRGVVRHAERALTFLAGGGNLVGMAGHSQLGAFSGYPSDGVKIRQVTERLCVADGDSNP